MMTISAMNALCTLTFLTSWLSLPVGSKRLQRRRAVWAGILPAIMFLFRYDYGVSMVVANLAAAAIMMGMQGPGLRKPLGRVVTAVILPPLFSRSVRMRLSIPPWLRFMIFSRCRDLHGEVLSRESWTAISNTAAGADISRRISRKAGNTGDTRKAGGSPYVLYGGTPREGIENIESRGEGEIYAW
jgi:hypothetical protein